MSATIYTPSILLLQILLSAISLYAYQTAEPTNVIRQAEQSSNTIPPIWSKEDGNTQVSLYRFLGEINLRDSDKSYRFSEFSSTSQAKFRFDFVEAASGRQFGFLADYNSGEVFRFSPFTCNLIEKEDVGELISAELNFLMPRVSLNNNGTQPVEELLLSAGLGSMWKYARKNNAKYHEPLVQLSNVTSDTSKLGLNIERLQKFTVQPTSEYPYELNLFFKPGKQISPKSLLLILLIDKGRPIMRIRLLESWSALEGPIPAFFLELDTIFGLPIGHGCQRSQTFDGSGRKPTSMLDSSLTRPHLIGLNVVSLHPPVDDRRAPLDKWRAHSSKIRIVAGQLSWTDNSRSDYLAMESQDFGSKQESETLFGSSIRAASLQRHQRLWDLGENGLTNFTDGNKAVYLDIDERRSKCLGYGQSLSIESSNVNLEQSDAPPPNDAKEAPAEVGVPHLQELTLNNEFLQLLFGVSVAGFQLIREGVQSRVVEMIFERRISDFHLRGKNGSVVWRGPVSIIRKEVWRIRTGQATNEMAPTGHSVSDVVLEWPPSKISGSVEFLEADLAGIISKLSMELIERRPVSRIQLHKQLSEAALLCYTQLESRPTSSTSNEPGQAKGKLARRHNAASLVALNYPLDIEPATRDNSLTGLVADQIQSLMRRRQELEGQIYEQFLGLLQTLSAGRFDSLRVGELAIRMDNDSLNVRIEARLIEQPALLSFVPEVELQTLPGGPQKQAGHIITELKESVAECANSCRHLSCEAFVYCRTSQECQLSYSSAQSDNSSTTNDCRHYRKTELAAKRPEAMSVSELVGKLRYIVENRAQKLALDIWIGFATQIKLIPDSLESGLVDTRRMLSEQNLLRWPEYELVLRGKRFIARKGLRVAHHIANYKDCELLCSQVDCRSFDHCPLEQVCNLDNDPEHDNSLALEQVTEFAEDSCNVFARSHLSKFERVGMPIAERSFIGSKFDQTLTGGSARDCAASCIHQTTGDKCRSFYYCTSGAATSTCLLQSTWLAVSSQPSSLTSADKKPPMTTDEPSDAKCQLYRRSYLVEFDKFPGRALLGETFALEQTGKEAVVSADACALECVSWLDEPCQAFQICRRAVDGSSTGEPQCSFRLGEELSTSAANTGASLPEMLDNDLCSVFVPATDSQLFGLASGANRERRSKTSASSLLNLLWELPILMGLGLAIGLTLAASLRNFGFNSSSW